MNQLGKFKWVKDFIQANIKLLALFAAITIGLSSCKGNNDIVPYGKPANLNVVNADTATLNIYQNGARLNNISSLAPGSQSGYISVPFGTKIYQVKKAGATNYLINNLQLTLDTTVYYTLFIAGETPDKLFLANDGLPPLSSTMATIRFVNASPAATNLDVYIGSLSFQNQAFKAVTAFTSVAGAATVITIYQHGSATPLFSTTQTLQAGGAYSLYTAGIPGGTGQNQFAVTLTQIN